jgi:Kef-type K+ transport system membrane component KefB
MDGSSLGEKRNRRVLMKSRPGSIAGAAAVAAVFALLPSAAFAAGGELPPLVRDIGMALFLSGVLAVLFARIKFPAIAGYILGGLIAGPLALGLVTDPANIDTIAQLGFVLLLFVIGLELNLAKIRQSGRPIVVTGVLQYPLMVLFGFLISKGLALLGLGLMLHDNISALYVGLVIACSSTLLVVKLFQETFEMDTVPGRVALGLLVFEDIWAIVIIVLQPSFDRPELGLIAASFVGIALLAAIAIVFSRTLFPIAFRWIAKVPEIILVGAIAWCFAIVFLGTSFDWVTETFFHKSFHLNVGAGMGALIAGATIASLPYATEIITKVSVVKDFFVTLFFVALGLSIPAPSGFGVVVLALLIAAMAILARQLIVFPLLYFTGLDMRNAEVTAIRMAQISEFSLVIAFLGADLGHITKDLQSSIIFAFVLTAILTTPLYHSAYRIYAVLAPVLRRLGFKDPPAAAAGGEQEWRLVILGFHRIASSLLHNLSRDDPSLVKETLVIDFNVALHDKIRQTGAHVEYGDLSNPDTLHHAGVDRARVVVSTVSDDLMRGTDNTKLVAAVRKINPHAIIVANAVNLKDAQAMYAAGANYVFLSRFDSASALQEAIGMALNGSLSDYKAARDMEHGRPWERNEVLG